MRIDHSCRNESHNNHATRERARIPMIAALIGILFLGVGIGLADTTDIVVDAGNISTYNSSSSSSFSWSHTVGTSLTSRYLVVCFSLTGNTTSTPTGIQVSSVSYAGTSMTRRVSQDTNGTQGRTEIWDLLAPTTGSNSVSVVLSTSTQVVASAVGFGNVSQTSPSRSSASTRANSTSISLAVTSASRDVLVDVVSATYPITLTPNSNQTKRWDLAVGTNSTDLRGSGSTKPGFGTFDGVSWTLSSATNWSISAESIQPPNTPTLARFVDFKASDTARGTLLRWRTGYEVKNLGFRIYRESAGERVPVNQQLIAGSALFRGPTKELQSGRSYSFLDTKAPRTGFSSYWIEDVALDGTSSWNGPYLSQPMNPEEEGEFLADMKAGRNFSPRLGDTRSLTPQTPDRGRLASTIPSKVATTSPWAPATGNAAKISVSREGFYRVTRAQLAATGFDPGPDPTNLQLLVEGSEVAIRLEGIGDGYFDMEDALEFYGRGIDTPSTGARVYWLIEGDEPGQRIRTFRRYPKREGGNRITDQFYPATVERRDHSIYVAALTENGERDNFYGPVIASTPVEFQLDADRVAHPNAPGNPAQLRVAVQGFTEGEHQLQVEFNTHDLGILSMLDATEGIFEAEIDPSWLIEGTNTLRLTALGGDTDVSVFDEASLTYDRPFFAMNDELSATAAPGAIVRMRGFSNPTIMVLDVSEELNPQILRGRRLGTSGIMFVTPPATGSNPDDVELFAFSANAIHQPDSITANDPSDWGSAAHHADLLILSAGQFSQAANTLAAHRRSQGFDVEVVNIEDLYDEFTWGEKDPTAIRDFLRKAASSWSGAPRYVLLLGDASFDPRDYLGMGNFDFIPTHLASILDIKTADDDWFGDLDGDGETDLAIGRLPVRTADEAATVVSKIIGYDSAPGDGAWTQSLSLVAGVGGDDFDFEAASDDLEALLPAGLNTDRISLGQLGADAAHAAVMNAFDEGRLIINYNGHGSQTIWDGGLLNSSDIAGMTNGDHLPLVMSMNCLNGFFQDLYQDSLAETMLKAPAGGAVAVWASSALTDPLGQAKLNEALYQRIFDGSHPALGDAMLEAKAEITDPYVRDSWIFFGDPSMKLK